MVDVTPWGLVDELVRAVGDRDERLEEVISAAGPARVADLLADEVRVRAEPPPGLSDVTLNLAMRHRGETFRYAATVKDGDLHLEPGGAGEVLAEVAYELLDLVRLLYPTRAGYRSTSRDVDVVTWPWTGDAESFSPLWPDKVVDRRTISPEQRTRLGMSRMSLLFKAVETVVAAATSAPRDLNHLAARYGSDKWGALHWYTPHYEAHFGDLRFEPIRVLEIGIGGYNYDSLGGESLYMWQRFFPRALVLGLDIFDKPGVTGPRIRTVQGDQNDSAFLQELGERFGPFDIVVDDGSHVNEHVRTSFQNLFPHVRRGGYYVIEDLHTAYWPEFGGQLPPGSSSTTTGMLKDLIDDLHRCEFEDAGTEPSHPSEVAIYHNLAVMRKGISHERGIPAWVQQRSDQWLRPGKKSD